MSGWSYGPGDARAVQMLVSPDGFCAWGRERED